MTRKDFIAIASAIKDARDALHLEVPTGAERITAQVFDSMAKSVAKVLATTNPRFDRARFLVACGVK